MSPVVVAGLERLFDQQPAKAGAVDEQVALDQLAGFDVFLAQSVDPWDILERVLRSPEDGVRRGRELLVMLLLSAWLS